MLNWIKGVAKVETVRAIIVRSRNELERKEM